VGHDTGGSLLRAGDEGLWRACTPGADGPRPACTRRSDPTTQTGPAQARNHVTGRALPGRRPPPGGRRRSGQNHQQEQLHESVGLGQATMWQVQDHTAPRRGAGHLRQSQAQAAPGL